MIHVLRAAGVATLLTAHLLSLLAGPAAAQPSAGPERGAAAVEQALTRANHVGSLLHVVAHPDDEDGAMLAAVARGTGARVMLFSLTRGEGGANRVSADFFDRLGLLRTLEHQQAARWYGIELFYSRAVDYGYSKTFEEANQTWQGGDFILEDLVRVIRRERPQIIAARFRGDPRDGHGHHQMSGRLARRAFDLAADPAAFPDQIKNEGLRPWRSAKLYHGNVQPKRDGEQGWTLALDVGRYDPILGRTYSQLARIGLGFQRSQGMNFFDAPAGPAIAYYARIDPPTDKTRPPRETSFFDGLDCTVEGLSKNLSRPSIEFTAALAELQTKITAAVQRKSKQEITPLVDALRAAAHAETAFPTSRETTARDDSADDRPVDTDAIRVQLRRVRTNLESALIAALGLDFRAVAFAPAQASGDEFPRGASGFEYATAADDYVVCTSLVHHGPQPIRLKSQRLVLPKGPIRAEPLPSTPSSPTNDPANVAPGQPRVERFRLPGASLPPPTRPYWSRPSLRQARYDLDPALVSPTALHTPLPAPPVVATAELEFQGALLTVEIPVTVRVDRPEWGPQESPLSVVPQLSIDLDREFAVVPTTSATHTVRATIRNYGASPAQGELSLQTPPGWKYLPASQPFRFSKLGESVELEFTLQVPAEAQIKNLPPAQIRATATTTTGQKFHEGFVTITNRDLDRVYYFQPAVQRVQVADLKFPPDLRIAYVAGTGDEVPLALAGLGLKVKSLSAADLATFPLDDFDAVLIGVRAYAVRDDLIQANSRLLEYVDRGGVMVVQYQTPEFDRNFGPFPYRMGGNPEEVSEEDAAVTILKPDHPLLAAPNKITPSDFDGWIEQRGSKFLSEWDERYVPLLECHDTGQPPQRGGLLVARHGKGVYIYAAYSWYRQLPQGVPGAYRILLNLLSAKRTMTR